MQLNVHTGGKSARRQPEVFLSTTGMLRINEDGRVPVLRSVKRVSGYRVSTRMVPALAGAAYVSFQVLMWELAFH